MVGQSFVCVNGPETLIAPRRSGPVLPKFSRNTVCGALVVPNGCQPKLSEPG